MSIKTVRPKNSICVKYLTPLMCHLIPDKIYLINDQEYRVKKEQEHSPSGEVNR